MFLSPCASHTHRHRTNSFTEKFYNKWHFLGSWKEMDGDATWHWTCFCHVCARKMMISLHFLAFLFFFFFLVRFFSFALVKRRNETNEKKVKCMKSSCCTFRKWKKGEREKKKSAVTFVVAAARLQSWLYAQWISFGDDGGLSGFAVGRLITPINRHL